MGIKKKVAVIGVGWLGKQLVTKLLSKGYDVVGTNRSGEGNANVKIHRMILNDQLSLSDDLAQADYVVITIPPLRNSDSEKYGNLLTELAGLFSSKTRFIFTSSTGIYPSSPGFYDESYSFSDSEVSELYHAENKLRDRLGDRLTILRLGGLIGINRHPIKYLSGRKDLSGGNDPAALIDGDDVCNVIVHLIEDEIFGRLFNVVFPAEISKREYYAGIAKKLGINPPGYKNDSDQLRRVIDSSKCMSTFGHILEKDIREYSQPLDF